jgi:outer membrane protein assembly factor BamB
MRQTEKRPLLAISPLIRLIEDMRIAVMLTLCTSVLCGSDWPRFRGPNGLGISPDRGLPGELSRDKNVAWSAKMPKGSSSPIVVDGRLILTGHEGDERIVLCHDSTTGEQLWRKSITKARIETFNPVHGPTTPTPATEGRRIFVFFPDFGLLAYEVDGKELWRTPLGPFLSVQGLAASPLYVDGKVVLLIDTPEEAYVAAFDAASGKQVWRTERPTGVLGSYSSPALYTRRGEEPQIVVAGAVELTGYQPATGERLWWAQGVSTFAAPPVIAGDSVYTVEPAGEGGWPPFGDPLKKFDSNKNGKIEISEAAADHFWQRSFKGIDKNAGNGDGAITEEEYLKAGRGGGGLVRTRLVGKGELSEKNVAWRHTKGMPALTGALLYENVLYVLNDSIISTFEPESGKLLQQGRVKEALGDYYASPVAADGKIYLASLEGKVSVLKAGADWEVLSTTDLGEQVIATPAIADGRVYIRTAGTLYCFGAKR